MESRFVRTLAVALTIGGLTFTVSGCGGSDEPVIGKPDPTRFQDPAKLMEKLDNAKSEHRRDAIVQLQRAWNAGELQKMSQDDKEKLKFILSRKAKNDDARVKREAKKLLAMMTGEAEGEGAEAPAEG